MALICISRGSFLGAKKLAEQIADKLALTCVSRELTIQVAEDLGLTEGGLNENETRPPWFLEKLSCERQSHLVAVRAALMQQAVHGGFVYHGNVGHLLIAEAPTVLRVRVVAPLELRLESGMRFLGCTRRQAEAHLETADRQRRDWARSLYDVDWTDASLYDLTINLEFIEMSEARDLVCELARRERYQRNEDDQRRIENLALASRVESTIGVDLASKLEITADAGHVTIRGSSFFGSRAAEIEEIARNVNGVEEVQCEISSAAERMGF